MNGCALGVCSTLSDDTQLATREPVSRLGVPHRNMLLLEPDAQELRKQSGPNQNLILLLILPCLDNYAARRKPKEIAQERVAEEDITAGLPWKYGPLLNVKRGP